MCWLGFGRFSRREGFADVQRGGIPLKGLQGIYRGSIGYIGISGLRISLGEVSAKMHLQLNRAHVAMLALLPTAGRGLDVMLIPPSTVSNMFPWAPRPVPLHSAPKTTTT